MDNVIASPPEAGAAIFPYPPETADAVLSDVEGDH